jgi:hypothetical protein
MKSQKMTFFAEISDLGYPFERCKQFSAVSLESIYRQFNTYCSNKGCFIRIDGASIGSVGDVAWGSNCFRRMVIRLVKGE